MPYLGREPWITLSAAVISASEAWPLTVNPVGRDGRSLRRRAETQAGVGYKGGYRSGSLKAKNPCHDLFSTNARCRFRTSDILLVRQALYR